MTGPGTLLVLAIIAGVALSTVGALVAASWLGKALRETAATDPATQRLRLKVDVLRADYELRLLGKRARQAWSERSRA